jgi:hypothetical protein
MYDKLPTLTKNEVFNFVKQDIEDQNRMTHFTKYYLNYYDKYAENRWAPQWNWAAFFFPLFWFTYRRMYLLALVYFALETLPIFLLVDRGGDISKLMPVYILILMLRLLVSIGIGIYGNALYFQQLSYYKTKGMKMLGIDMKSVWVIIGLNLLYSLFMTR